MAKAEITTVDILRHGACVDGNILRGRTDSLLSVAGREQMSSALTGLSGWGRVVTSPLKRCHGYARSLAEQRSLPLSIRPDWRELDFGAWDGRHPGEISEREAEAFDRYYREPGSVTPAGGEPLTTAGARVTRAWRQLLADFRGEHLLVISHGGVVRLLLAALQGAPLSATHFFHIPYGSLTRLRVYHGDEADFVRLVFHGRNVS